MTLDSLATPSPALLPSFLPNRHVYVLLQVLYCKENLAIISGLNSDAPIGTKLTFVTGGTGVLLWHRSDNLVFALILGGAYAVKAGDRVECKIKGVLQVRLMTAQHQHRDRESIDRLLLEEPSLCLRPPRRSGTIFSALSSY